MTQGPVVGVLSTSFGGYYFGGLLQGIRAEMATHGGRLIAIQTLDAGTFDKNFKDPPPFPHRVSWDHIDGFIAIMNGASPAYIRLAQASGRPVVVVSDSPEGVVCPTVRPDNDSGIFAAVRHLTEHGHSKIAFAGYLDHFDARERYAAYLEAMLAHGLDPKGLHFDTGGMQESGGKTAAREMLAAGLPSTAVLCGNDQNAFGLLWALADAGCQLPDDQAVIGFDDMLGAASIIPSLTSVRQPLDEVGAVAARLVVRMVNGTSVPGEVHRIPTTLVVRESCGCLGPLALTSGHLDDNPANADRLLRYEADEVRREGAALPRDRFDDVVAKLRDLGNLP